MFDANLNDPNIKKLRENELRNTGQETFGTYKFREAFNMADARERYGYYAVGGFPDWIEFKDKTSAYGISDVEFKCRGCAEFQSITEYSSAQMSSEMVLLKLKKQPLCRKEECQKKAQEEFKIIQQKQVELNKLEQERKMEIEFLESILHLEEQERMRLVHKRAEEKETARKKSEAAKRKKLEAQKLSFDAPKAPTKAPTKQPTEEPEEPAEKVKKPRAKKVRQKIELRPEAPTDAPTNAPTNAPNIATTDAPTNAPTNAPTEAPNSGF